MENFYTLLARHPPFDGIDPEEVREALEGASKHAFDTGQTALVEDGAPALGLWVMGCAYNIRPLRTKDVPYLDVLTDSVRRIAADDSGPPYPPAAAPE